jgi:hypothetical protein
MLSIAECVARYRKDRQRDAVAFYLGAIDQAAHRQRQWVSRHLMSLEGMATKLHSRTIRLDARRNLTIAQQRTLADATAVFTRATRDLEILRAVIDEIDGELEPSPLPFSPIREPVMNPKLRD